uniref:Uncharacterized protein n=1 Tax=Aquilaria malaccensis TaxID=223753 RepID=A0A4Y6GLN1_9ROSI|nr:hypothetical protein [Aquilaria malaccensis]
MILSNISILQDLTFPTFSHSKQTFRTLSIKFGLSENETSLWALRKSFLWVEHT